MKKHLHNSLRALFLSLAVLLSLPMLAEEVKIDGINYELNAETKQATVKAKSNDKYSGDVVIPESVEFDRTAYSVTSIGLKAFDGCSRLTSVTIPNSVTSIGYQAFGYCSGLTSVTIGNSVESIGEGAFYFCDGLTSVTIGNSVTSIGKYAFSFCSGLTSVTIPNSVTSIGYQAFGYCSGLTSVTIGNSVTSIGDYAFSDCSGLTSVTIPNSVTSIGESAFSRCSGLTSVTIGNSVTSIGDYAFSRCSGLTSIVVEEGNTVYDSRNNCNAIIETASNTLHLGCKTTVIPNSVTSIGGKAFYACSGLTSVTIPNSVKSIGESAFQDCSGLTSITIPNSVTSIGGKAFCYCYGLTSVTIGNGVESIGTAAFSDCSGLTSVTIGNGVESIGAEAFCDCPELHDVYCYAENVPTTESNAFEDSPIENATLHVPANAVKRYAASWTSFGTITSTVEVSSVGYATLFLDYDAEIPEGIEAYIAKEVVGENLRMEKVENQECLLPAETGVIIKAEAGKYDFNLYPNANSVSVDGNLFVGSAIETKITAEDNTSYYILAATDDNVGMYPVVLVGGAFVCKANKAYLPISSALARIYFDFGTETGILETENGNVKTENCYDLSGRRVQNAQKGIFIVNGKKVVK